MKDSVINIVAVIICGIYGIGFYDNTLEGNRMAIASFILATIQLALFIVNRINETK